MPDPLEHLESRADLSPRTLREQLEALLVGLAEAARITGLSTRTLRRMAEDGWPPARRVSRRLLFSVAEIRAWIERGCPAPTPARPKLRVARGRK